MLEEKYEKLQRRRLSATIHISCLESEGVCELEKLLRLIETSFYPRAIPPLNDERIGLVSAMPYFASLYITHVKLNKWRQLLSLHTARDMNFVHFPAEDIKKLAMCILYMKGAVYS
jgi:hypothetical protein